MHVVALEFFKLRRRRVLPMIVLFLGVEILWASISVSNSFTRNPDSAGWEGIITTFSSMNGLFLPILSAIVVSRIVDMEHKGETWRLLGALAVNRHLLFAAKYGCAASLLLTVVLLQTFAIPGIGWANGLEAPIPYELLFRFLAGTMLVNLVIIALQQWVSLAVRNQAFGLCLGMVGGFFGLTADLFPVFVRRLLIWSNYTALRPVTLRYGDDTVRFVTQDAGWILPTALLLVGAALYLAGSLHLSRKNI